MDIESMHIISRTITSQQNIKMDTNMWQTNKHFTIVLLKINTRGLNQIEIINHQTSDNLMTIKPLNDTNRELIIGTHKVFNRLNPI